MLGLSTGQPLGVKPDGKILPAESHGLKAVSMGLLTGDDAPAILRGPMVSKYLRLLIDDVHWGTLDYLILDLPPGTRRSVSGCNSPGRRDRDRRRRRTSDRAG
jgi:ATP-binding protein involved in chromosome partitioning